MSQIKGMDRNMIWYKNKLIIVPLMLLVVWVVFGLSTGAIDSLGLFTKKAVDCDVRVLNEIIKEPRILSYNCRQVDKTCLKPFSVFHTILSKVPGFGFVIDQVNLEFLVDNVITDTESLVIGENEQKAVRFTARCVDDGSHSFSTILYNEDGEQVDSKQEDVVVR